MKVHLAWLLMLPLTSFVACNGDHHDPDTDPPAGDDDDLPGDDDDDGTLDPARLRVLHLADALGPVDVFAERIDPADDDTPLDERDANEVVVVEALGVDEITDWLTVASGTREVELHATGTPTPVLDIDLALAPDTDTTLVVWGELPDLQWLAFEDDPATVPADLVGVDFLNLDEGAVTVFDATPAAPLMLLAQIPPEGVTVPPAAHARLELEADVGALGLDLDGDGVIDLEIPLPPEMAPGALHLLALHLDETGAPSLLWVDAEGQPRELPAEPPAPALDAMLRVGNVSPVLGSRDVYVERVAGEAGLLVERPIDEVLFFDDLAFASASAWFSIQSGLRQVEIYEDGALTPLLGTDVDLTTDEGVTAFVWGPEGAIDVHAVADDREGLADAQTALLFTHLAQNVGVIDIFDVSDPGTPVLLAEDLALESTQRVDVDPAITELGIDFDDDGVVDATAIIDLLPRIPGEQVHYVLHENAVGTVAFMALAEDGTSGVAATLP